MHLSTIVLPLRVTAATACLLMALTTAVPVVSAQSGDTAATPPAPDTAAATATDQTTDGAGQVIPLGEVDVHGKRNLFDEQAARRRKLLDGSAPCLGCDAKPIEHHRKLLERVADYALDQVTPQSAPEKDEAGNLDHQLQVESAHPTNSNP